MGECSVCCETLNNSYRSNVECPHCKYKVCAECCSTYLCDTPEYAHCMNCKKGWDRGFMSQYISKAFVKGRYKAAREKHLLDKEMALMPATQIDVECIRYKQKQERKMREIAKEIGSLQVERGRMWTVDLQSLKIAQQLEIDIFVLKKKQDICRFKLDHTDSKVNPKKTFIRKCGGDACKGFLSTQWKCGLCEKYTCKDCLEVKLSDQEHTCDPDAVETAKLLATDSKPCPSCGTVIFKIDGCDQMYCVMCHTAFSWRSGHIVTGRIHNPHYFEYRNAMNMQIREIGDVPCGGMPLLRHMPAPPPHIYDDVWGAYRLCIHIQEETIPRLAPRDTKQFRIDYLMGYLSEAGLKSDLQRIEKANSKKLEYRLIYSMFSDVAIDLYRNVTLVSQYEQLVVEMKNLVNYANDQFVRIADAFGCKPPRIWAQGWSLNPPLVNRP